MSNKSELVKKQLTKNTIMLSFSSLINRGLMFVMVPFFSRWLTVAEYGTYDVYSTYVTLLIPVITLASSNAVFRLSIDCDSLEKKAYYITNGLFISVVNLIVAILIITFISIKIQWIYYFPFIVLLRAEIFDNYFQGYLRAIKKLNIYAICKTATVIVTVIMVTLLVKKCNLGLYGILYGYASGFVRSSLLIFFRTKYWKWFNINSLSFNGVKELISYSYPLIPNDISWWVINVSDRAIINFILGDIANGVYAIACKLPNLCSSIFGLFNTSWQEASVDMVNNEEGKAFFNNIYNNMFVLLMSLCMCIISSNFIFFDYIFDAKYTTARLYTPILISSVIFSMLSQFFGGIQISLKQPKANGITTIIGAIVNLSVHVLLIKRLGLFAAAISTLVSNICVAFLRKNKIKNYFSLKLNKINYICIFAYLYIFSVSYLKIENLWFNIINLMISAGFALIFNKNIVVKIIKKLIV